MKSQKRLNVILALTAALVALMATAAAPALAQQMFKPNPGGQGVSAYLIKPAQGLDKLPEGWTRNAAKSHANCALAGEVLLPAATAAPLVTVSYELPKADYEVSLCCIGKGKARLKGAADWVPVGGQADSYYAWTKVGSVKDATKVEVEVAPADDKTFSYAGLVAEGSAVPVIPVGAVLEKLKKGEPVTICLIGDSVTENARGFRGGSSKFETGGPGLMKKYLQDEFKNEVSYISHREPAGWPDDAGLTMSADGKKVEKFDETKVKMVTLDGVKYRDGRVEYDAAKKIRLVNMGKGGAASSDAWGRLPETFNDSGDWRLIGKGWMDTSAGSVAPPLLRNGVSHYKPDLVFINFGTNDANGSHLKWTAADYIFHMKVLATMIQKDLGAAVVLTTPHKWTEGTHQNPHTQLEMVDAIRHYCQKSGFALADIYNEYDLAEGDGIHPADSGHKHIADAYFKALKGEKSEPKAKAAATAEQFKDNGDGTVTDTKNGLMLTKDANLMGGAKAKAEAEAYLKTMNSEKKFGHDDWRLPTKAELLNLVDPAARPAVLKGVPLTNLGRHYLTSDLAQKKYTTLVDMQYGVAYFSSAKNGDEGFLWPVRSAK